MNVTEIAKKREFIVRGIHAQKCIKAEHFSLIGIIQVLFVQRKTRKVKSNNDWTW
jgi:hypothetical protein